MLEHARTHGVTSHLWLYLANIGRYLEHSGNQNKAIEEDTFYRNHVIMVKELTVIKTESGTYLDVELPPPMRTQVHIGGGCSMAYNFPLFGKRLLPLDGDIKSSMMMMMMFPTYIIYRNIVSTRFFFVSRFS